ncbi:MAG: PEP/pyruvate-binding domain-containing protein, partial [Anaerolineales bacterium]
MTLEYILPLSDSKATLETVGGKGASLVRLINAELAVPGGFHITTETYRRFIAYNNLQPYILEAIAKVEISKHTSVENASRKIQDLIHQAEMPSDIASEIVQAYAELPGNDP